MVSISACVSLMPSQPCHLHQGHHNLFIFKEKKKKKKQQQQQ